MDWFTFLLTSLGSAAATIVAIGTFLVTRPKIASEVDLNEVDASKKTVEMTLAFAAAADQKAKDIDVKMKELQTDLKDLQTKFNIMSEDYVSLLGYVAKLRAFVASIDPNHPLLAHKIG